MILVIGATGATGRALVDALSASGHPFKCAVRSVERAGGILGNAVELIAADLEAPASIETAAQGCDKIFLLSGHSPQMAGMQIAAIDAAKGAGVRHVVKSSGLMYSPDMLIPRLHREIEEHLQASGLEWTILRPNFFMPNFLNTAPMVKEQGKIMMPFLADIPITMIDVRDTADVAVKALTEDGHTGKIYALAGGRETPGRFARLLSDALSREIPYIQITTDQLRGVLEKRGLPDWAIQQQLDIEKDVNAGGLDIASNDVARVTGHAPRNLADFVAEHAPNFQS
jgi:uncharacterized protein YbjT (DUF2867 family)